MRLPLQNQIIISSLLATSSTAQLPTSSPAPTGFFGPPTIIATLPATTTVIATLPSFPEVRSSIIIVDFVLISFEWIALTYLVCCACAPQSISTTCQPTYQPTESTIQTPAPVLNPPVPSPIPVVNTPVPVFNLFSTPEPTDAVPIVVSV
jgi:hypothetical protein